MMMKSMKWLYLSLLILLYIGVGYYLFEVLWKIDFFDYLPLSILTLMLFTLFYLVFIIASFYFFINLRIEEHNFTNSSEEQLKIHSVGKFRAESINTRKIFEIAWRKTFILFFASIPLGIFIAYLLGRFLFYKFLEIMKNPSVVFILMFFVFLSCVIIFLFSFFNIVSNIEEKILFFGFLFILQFFFGYSVAHLWEFPFLSSVSLLVISFIMIIFIYMIEYLNTLAMEVKKSGSIRS